MPAPFLSGWSIARGGQRVLAVFVFACLFCPGLALPAQPGGIGGTGIGGVEETGGIGGTGIQRGEDTGGIGGTGINGRAVPIVGFGPIQRFGSVFVNGREYSIDARTQVTMDGVPATVASLRVGDMTLVHGIVTGPHTGVAGNITVWQSIVGPVGAVEAGGKAIIVLGQLVHLSDAVSSVRPGDVVGVSAQRSADGSWIASRMTVLPPSPRVRLQTTIEAVGKDSISFEGLTMRAPPSLLVNARVGQNVVANGLIEHGSPRLTALMPRPVALGAPGTRVEVQNFFRSVGGGRLVAPDGMVAVGASGTAHLLGLHPADIVGRISPAGGIEIDHLQIAIPEMATDTSLRDEPATGTPGVPVREPAGHADQDNQAHEPAPPAAVEPPEVGEPGEMEVEPPDIHIPEPQAPEPDIDAPEVEPPNEH